MGNGQALTWFYGRWLQNLWEISAALQADIFSSFGSNCKRSKKLKGFGRHERPWSLSQRQIETRDKQGPWRQTWTRTSEAPIDANVHYDVDLVLASFHFQNSVNNSLPLKPLSHGRRSSTHFNFAEKYPAKKKHIVLKCLGKTLLQLARAVEELTSKPAPVFIFVHHQYFAPAFFFQF